MSKWEYECVLTQINFKSIYINWLNKSVAFKNQVNFFSKYFWILNECHKEYNLMDMIIQISTSPSTPSVIVCHSLIYLVKEGFYCNWPISQTKKKEQQWFKLDKDIWSDFKMIKGIDHLVWNIKWSEQRKYYRWEIRAWKSSKRTKWIWCRPS